MSVHRAQPPPTIESLLTDHQRQALIREAVLARFEFTDSLQDRVRRTEAYDVGAAAIGRAVSPFVVAEVTRVVLEHGAIRMQPFNRRWFGRMRAKAAELVPGATSGPERGRTGSTAALVRAWRDRLVDEGLGEEPGELPKLAEYRRTINAAFFERARSWYWRQRERLDIWGLYALEGLSIREIEARTGRSRRHVHQVVAEMRKAMGDPGHPDPDERGEDE